MSRRDLGWFLLGFMCGPWWKLQPVVARDTLAGSTDE